MGALGTVVLLLLVSFAGLLGLAFVSIKHWQNIYFISLDYFKKEKKMFSLTAANKTMK